jgi:predicted ATPase
VEGEQALEASAVELKLLERQGELEAGRVALGRCADGEGGMLAFVGPAGIGKSELLAELVRQAADQEIRVLQARGTELERDFAFGIARQLFEPLLAGLSEEERRELFEGAAAHAAPLLDPASAADAAPSLDPSFGSLHGLYWLTANLAARQPILIAVDDAHWADRASLRWLVHLAARLEGVPALLAFAIREPEPGLDEPLVEELLAVPGCGQIRPRPLSTDAVGRLTSDSLGSEADPAFVTACERSTGGNPFLVRELLADLSLDGQAPTEDNVQAVEGLGPRNVSRSVLGRIGRLPEACLSLATALAVLGDGASLSTTAALRRAARSRCIARQPSCSRRKARARPASRSISSQPSLAATPGSSTGFWRPPAKRSRRAPSTRPATTSTGR